MYPRPLLAQSQRKQRPETKREKESRLDEYNRPCRWTGSLAIACLSSPFQFFDMVDRVLCFNRRTGIGSCSKNSEDRRSESLSTVGCQRPIYCIHPPYYCRCWRPWTWSTLSSEWPPSPPIIYTPIYDSLPFLLQGPIPQTSHPAGLDNSWTAGRAPHLSDMPQNLSLKSSLLHNHHGACAFYPHPHRLLVLVLFCIGAELVRLVALDPAMRAELVRLCIGGRIMIQPCHTMCTVAASFVGSSSSSFFTKRHTTLPHIVHTATIQPTYLPTILGVWYFPGNDGRHSISLSLLSRYKRVVVPRYKKHTPTLSL